MVYMKECRDLADLLEDCDSAKLDKGDVALVVRALRDAARYDWIKRTWQPGAPHNAKLLNGHRDHNRALVSFLFRQEACSAFGMYGLDAGVDKAMEGWK
jgi:hypothetical protein